MHGIEYLNIPGFPGFLVAVGTSRMSKNPARMCWNLLYGGGHNLEETRCDLLYQMLQNKGGI